MTCVTVFSQYVDNMAVHFQCMRAITQDKNLAVAAMRPPWRMFWETCLPSMASLGAVPEESAQCQRQRRENWQLEGDIATWQSLHEPDAGCAWTIQEKHMKEWLLYCSWGLCPDCNVFFQRTLTEAELRDPQCSRPRLVAKCYQCQKHPHDVPQCLRVDDWPDCLKGLPDEVLYALRPLVLHQGNPRKHPHGYRRKAQASRVSWNPLSVRTRVQLLEGPARDRGITAYEWLLASSDVYRAWVRAHEAILESHSPVLKLWPNAITEPYIEAALWPTLYYLWEHCESRSYATDDWCTPFQRQHGERVCSAWTSAKHAFVRKLCSCVVDYSRYYDLLQFQFDRHLLRTLHKKACLSDAKGFDTHLALAHQHWHPSYWIRHHAILLDLTAQLGYPDLFLTVSPYEWFFPYPYWIQKVHQAMHKGPTDCSGPEVLAVAHALHQMCAGWLAGKTSAKQWKTHVFGDKTSALGAPIKGFFGRYEFQEEGEEQIFGRGRGSIHLHCLFWFVRMQDVLLELILYAHVPSGDAEVAATAMRVLKGGACKATVREERSMCTWSAAHGRFILCLHVSASFIAAGLRPFLVPLLRVFRCSQDVQWWEGTGALLRYVNGYVSKHSENWQTQWLSEAQDPMSAALNVCRWWHPCEAEMVMTLAREAMVFMSCDHKDYRPPSFTQGEDAVLHLYRRRAQSLCDLSCLEWYRTHTVSGSLNTDYEAHPRKSKTLMAVGINYYNAKKDEYFWQWMLMHIAHRSFADLLPEAMWRVTPKYRFFTAALVLRRQQWGSTQWVCQHARLQGHKEAWVQTYTNDLAARRELVSMQLDGRMPKYALGPVVTACSEVSLSAAQANFVERCLNDSQMRREGEEIVSSGTVQRRRIRFLSGIPGSGKSACIQALLKRTAAAGLKTLVVSPTGQLACSVRSSELVECMTYHRAFGIQAGALSDRSEFLQKFDFWILGEVGMVAADDFDMMIGMWFNTDRLPVFIVEGDLSQLPPPVPHALMQDVRLAKFWPLIQETRLTTQFRCQDPELLAFQRATRTGQPSNAAVHGFFSELILGPSVSADVFASAWAAFPDMLVLCATQATVHTVNRIGLEYFGSEWLAEIPVWNKHGEEDATVESLWLRKGSKVRITRNGDLDYGICNGLLAEVLGVTSSGITVAGPKGICCLHRRSEYVQRTLRSGFDVDLGYACTVHAAEGCTLDSCAIVFEDFAPPAWGYTAITRVRTRAGLRAIGAPCSWHFRPRHLVQR